MEYEKRQKLYKKIQKSRNTRVIGYVTGDRQNLETQISPDCIDPFVDLLDRIGPTPRISLVLHTNGGSTLTAWRVVNLLRTFCDELEVLIPMNALSAGTLISIGADKIIMTKQAALGPIDPSVNSPLAPTVMVGAQQMKVPVSVESVLGYLSAAKDELNLHDESSLSAALAHLSGQVHPLVIGEIFRARNQIRFLARKLITRQVTDNSKVETIVNFLCADSGSHDYTLNRREALEFGLSVEKPSDELYLQMKAVHDSYKAQLLLQRPYAPQALVAAGSPTPYAHVRGLIESVDKCFAFVSEGVLSKSQVPGPMGMQEMITDQRHFDGWKEMP